MGKILEITKDVKWIGVLDPGLVTFDIVMETKYGTTYNSYFIDGDKKAIIETTKNRFWDQYYEKIQQVTKIDDLDYVILNHTEPDHSGNLENLLKVAKNITVVGSGSAIRYLKELTNIEFKHIVVKDGDNLDLGNKTLKFISAPNLHWPDSIYTYLVEDKVLFTCDSFGSHFSDQEMFDDKVPNFDEAFKYYFDVILKPYSKFMLKAIDKIKDIDISVIAPGHGPILRSNWKKYVDLSKKYAEKALEKPENKQVFIPYVSAYQNTEIIAKQIAKGVEKVENIDVNLVDIETVSFGEMERFLTNCSGVIVGSPTINQNILPQIYQLFSAINPIRDRGKLAGSFGSFGWSGEAKKIIESSIKELKLKYIGEGVFIKFTPDYEDFQKAIEYGENFGKELLKRGC